MLKSPLPVVAWGVSATSGIRLGLHWKLRILETPFGFLVLKPSLVPTVRGCFIPKILSRVGAIRKLELGLG